MGNRWLRLLLQASKLIEEVAGSPASELIKQGKSIEELTTLLEGAGHPVNGLKYAYEVWDSSNVAFQEFGSIQNLYEELKASDSLERLPTYDFYAYGPVMDLLAATREKGDIAVMPLGAGGPGANLITLTSNPRGVTYLKEVLAAHDILEMDEQEVTKIVEGTGTVRGWMPFTVGETPWHYDVSVDVPEDLKGDDQFQRKVKNLVKKVKANAPAPGVKATYDPRSGHIERAA